MAVTYDSNTALLTGDKIMLYVEVPPTSGQGSGTLTPVAFGTGCSIEITADTIDTSNKMSGDWKEFLTAQLGFTANCDSMLSFTDGHLSFNLLREMMSKRKAVAFVMAMPADTTEFAKGTEYVRGKAVITSLSMTANNGEICSCSLQMQGTGALEEGAAVPAAAQTPNDGKAEEDGASASE